MAKKELDLNNDGAIDIQFGGTGGTTAAAARVALGVIEPGTGPSNAVTNFSHESIDHSGIPGAGSSISTISDLTATSVTSVTIGTGTKTFTIQAGKAFVPGMTVIVASNIDPAGDNMVMM